MLSNEQKKQVEKVYDGFIKQCLFNRYIIFYIVAILHLVWGISLLLTRSPLLIESLKHVFDDVPFYHAVAWGFICSSLFSFYVISREFKLPFTKALCLLPQQVTILWSALSAVACIIKAGHPFATLATEAPLILLAIFHTVVLIYNFVMIPVAGKRNKKNKYL